MMETGYLLGIDFGACNIKVSRYDRKLNKVLQLKIDKDQQNTDAMVPNVIRYKSREDFQVGKIAQNMEIFRNADVISHVKRKLEYKDWRYTSKTMDWTLSAEEIVQDILSWVTDRVRKKGEIAETLVTVPVCFSEVQKNKLLTAARAAGMPVRMVLTEPVAALFDIEELFEEEVCSRNVVVFDFGGATLDLCLFHIEKNGDIDIDILVSNGISFGGIDVTQALYQYVIEPKYHDLIAEEKQKNDPDQVEYALMETLESLKKQVLGDEEDSAADYYNSPGDGTPYELELTLTEAIEALHKTGIADRIRTALDELFEDVDCIKEEVSLVRTFGGTSRIAFFRELLTDYFGEDIVDPGEYDPDTAYRAVANGAARYLGILCGSETDVYLNDIIPFYIGMERNGVFEELIKRNQTYGSTPYQNITAAELDAMGWKFSLYQTFSREHTSLDGEDGAVYLGSIALDRELYHDAENILYKFRAEPGGKIIGMYFVTDEENDIIPVEEKELVIGG